MGRLRQNGITVYATRLSPAGCVGVCLVAIFGHAGRASAAIAAALTAGTGLFVAVTPVLAAGYGVGRFAKRVVKPS